MKENIPGSYTFVWVFTIIVGGITAKVLKTNG
jgi:hypothetical protein